MRPTLLVAEREPENALTVRKLVLETAKYNVITAYSPHEAVEAFSAFPAVAAAVITANLGAENDCEMVASHIKKANPDIPVIYLSPTGMSECKWADHLLSTYEPDALVQLARRLLGDPAKADQK